MKDKRIKKEESNTNVPGMIISIFLLIAVIVGLFFFIRWFVGTLNNKGDDTTEKSDGEKANNKLLSLLNDSINKTKIGDEKLANEITSFSYLEKHFYISGYNGNTVYQYDLDLSSKTLANTKDALDFILDNEIESSYDISLDRYTPIESNEFVTKYVGEGVKGKYHIGQMGSEQCAFATLLKDEQITVINGAALSDALSSIYSPTIINKTDSLFSVYQYIASK